MWVSAILSILFDLTGAGSTQRPVSRAEWQRRFDELGYDRTTFPVSFEQLVERISVHLQEEIREQARIPGSPLLSGVVLDDLDILTAAARNITQVFHGWSPARLLPLGEALQSALSLQRGLCEAAGRPFFTPDLLLALLTMPGGRVARCFNQAEPGWASRVRSQLQSYASSRPACTSGGFVAFDWVEREDVRKAQDAAWRAGAPMVTDVHLLLGVLETPSKTRQELQTRFSNRVERLREVALDLASQPPVGPTPGGDIFPEAE